jgi:DNA-binding transcriptional LysR family regulator
MNPPIDSRQLHAFLILARTGSFTQTARELFLTQSAVSHSIKSLETDMGCRLFDRVGKTVMLTQAGEQLLPHAEKILREMEQARVGMGTLKNWGYNRLRVGAPAAFADSLIPSVLLHLRKDHPRTLPALELTDGTESLDPLEARRVDLTLALAGKPDERFLMVPLFQDELAFAVLPAHPWAKLGSAPLDQIGPQPLILPGRNTASWRLIDEHFRADQITLNPAYESASIDASLALARGGAGVALVPSWSITKESELVSVSTGRRRLRRQWVLVHWRGRRLNLVETAFVEACRKLGETLVTRTGAKP